MNLRKAAEMALERLESHEYWMDEGAIKALRQALAQPEQEPVAWGLPNLQDPIRRKQALLRVDLKIPDGAQFPQFWVPLYTAPPKREWVGLTDEDKEEIKNKATYDWDTTAGEYASEVQTLTEAKLKEKNG